MEHVMEASRNYIDNTMKVAVQPTAARRSQPSPRAAKAALARLSAPIIRKDHNRNPSIDEYGYRIIVPSAVERVYSHTLDNIAHEVYVPPHMRQKMVNAIIETDNPKAYNTLKNFEAHFMTSSAARSARMQREKKKMKPSTLRGEQNKFQNIMAQEKVNADEQFTEKLIKVMLVLQSNDNNAFQLDLQSKEKEKASLRSVHIKVVVAAYFGNILQSSTRKHIRRERKSYHDRVVYEKKCEKSQMIISRKWRQHRAYLKAKVIVDELRAIKSDEMRLQKEEEDIFFENMKHRMEEEQETYMRWLSKNTNVSLSIGRHKYDNGDGNSNEQFLIPIISNQNSDAEIPMRPTSNQRHQRQTVFADSHIEELMQKYAKPSIQDGIFRKKRFCDILL